MHASNRSRLFLATAAALVCGSAVAQGGGFVAGDMYLYSPFLLGTNTDLGGVLKIDPLSGASSTHFQFDHSTTAHGMMGFDPYRQRLLVVGSPNNSGSDANLVFLVDGNGAAIDAGFFNVDWRSFAATGDGRVYFRDQKTNTAPYKYIDAANRVRTLMDASGAAPYVLPGPGSSETHGMIYDAGTNSLFLSNRYDCAGTATSKLEVHKLQLSADGTRVTAPPLCSGLYMDSSGGSGRGWSRNAAGEIFLVGDTNSSGQAPRLGIVDPISPLITMYAANGGYTGANTVTAGAWSSRIGKLLITSHAENKLRGYSNGEGGVGSYVVTLSQTQSTSSEPCTLIDIAPSACSGGWIAYGAGLAGKGAKVPGIYGTGCPEPGNGITLRIDDVVGAAPGALAIGFAPSTLQLFGGILHVGGPLTVLNVFAAGAPGVAGAGSVTLPITLGADPSLTGLSVYLQAGFYDSAAVQQIALTQGLRIEIG
ncbi:MAG: hypothetical protein EPO68_02395 [Planctomycetota bacterium]|nr:MAG: hypothetical protein EPO68_02395 [Planctomycetota bacterium]